eukprot:TRINITY_DN1426_c0_g1_i1.p1 TRINITY_DN1426_c0_g1~~TRINITY_DN1426_c0_g1_i1.p1  ORF type:complete len:632 (+),score=196.74 TRINITY_DN1426_c0_g1_i1:108-2003(+)
MFRKPLKKKGNLVSVKSSETRRLRRSLSDKFELLAPSQLDEIWPKDAAVVCQKLKDHAAIYYVNESPLLFTTHPPTMKDPVVWPSMYFLHRAPQIMPTVTIYDGVGAKLIKGTELFMPGVVVNDDATLGRSWVSATFGTFHRGDAVVIVEQSNWMPIAIATWNVSADELEYRGRTGQSHDILHVIDDHLWLEGDGQFPDAPVTDVAAALQQVSDAVENQRQAELAAAREARLKQAQQEQDAFVAEAPKQIKRKEKALRAVVKLVDDVESGRVVPDADQQAKMARRENLEQEIAELRARLARIQAGEEPLLPDEDEEKVAVAAEDGRGFDDGGVAQDEGESAVAEDIRADAELQDEASNDNADNEGVVELLQNSNADEAGSCDDGDKIDDDGATDMPSLLDMDQVLERAVIIALHDLVKDSDLPMLLSTLYANHVLPTSRRLRNAPQLNVKQTRWKKFGAYMKHLDDDITLVEIEDVKAGVQLLRRCDRMHSMYFNYDNAWLLTDEEMATDEDDGVQFYTTAKAAKAQASAFVVPKSGPQKIVIEQKRIANKNMTVVSALSRFGIRLDDELKRAVAKRFSVAVSYADSPDASLGRLLRVQGKYLQELADFLMERYSIPKRYITILKAKGKKK